MNSFSLKEKTRFPIETIIKIFLYSFNFFGIMILARLVIIFKELMSEDKIIEIAKILGNQYDEQLQGKILMIFQFIVAILVCTIIGIMYIFAKLVCSEMSNRKYDISLLMALGYNDVKNFGYQIVCIMSDVLAAVIVSVIETTIFFGLIEKLDRIVVIINLTNKVPVWKCYTFIGFILMLITIVIVYAYVLKVQYNGIGYLNGD